MKKIKVYDAPLRLFHWFFVLYFLTAFLIGKYVDDHSETYPYHMLAGLMLGLTVIFRLIWGFVGSKYARFNSFNLNLKETIQYFKDTATSKTKLYLGHNPASSWAAVIMIMLTIGLVTTGYLMTANDEVKKFKDIHELFANTFIIVVIGHIIGIILHTIKHKDPIGLSMIKGDKNTNENEQGILNMHYPVALLFLGIVIAFNFTLKKNFEPSTKLLKIFGQTLFLGDKKDLEEENKKEVK